MNKPYTTLTYAERRDLRRPFLGDSYIFAIEIAVVIGGMWFATTAWVLWISGVLR
jgi:hypothetical protein